MLTDDPAFDRSLDVTRDLVGLLERWHWHIANVVFPRVFAAMSAPEPQREGPAAGP
jgi:hypothetical protein